MSFQRARTENQIQDRIQEIVDAATSIYDSVGYDGLSFTTISEYTKFTRPNIYKYFKTKDEILLFILINEFRSFTSDLVTSYRLNRVYTIAEIAETWTDTLMKHERFLDLYSLLFTVIEKNVTVQALAEFKKKIITMPLPLCELASQLFPEAKEDSISSFVTTQLALAFSLYPMSKLNHLQAEAITLSGINYKPIDFKESYQSVLYKLMYCLQNSIE